MKRSSILRIEAVTRTARDEMIARISTAIQSAGGYILDFRFFSNVALFIAGEISLVRIDALRQALAGTELEIDPKSIRLVEELAVRCGAEGQAGQDCLFHLFVTFIHSEPDLRIAVPAVPG